MNHSLQQARPRDEPFDLEGHLALDFCNTIGDWRAEVLRERLFSFSRLVEFGRETGALTAPDAAGLLEEASNQPESASAALAAALTARRRIFVMLAAAAAGHAIAREDLDWLADAARPHLGLAPRDEGYEWTSASGGLDAVLGAVLVSAANLVVSPDLASLRECGAGECSWLFFDRSRNNSRRWCSMASCGNRAKARRLQARKKAREERRDDREAGRGVRRAERDGRPD
jgi:predicted RNA-binding Zn ribbon-like protein